MNWIISVKHAGRLKLNPHFMERFALVGPAHASTLERALQLAEVPEEVCKQIRANKTVRDFVEGHLDPAHYGYYLQEPVGSEETWCVCIGSVHEVIHD